jgi:hypothetical protein
MYLQSIKSGKDNAAKPVNRSILKKSRHIGFGVIIIHSSMGCRIGPPGYIGRRAGTTTLCRSQLLYIPRSGTMNLAIGHTSSRINNPNCPKLYRAPILKLLRSSGIDFKELIPLGYMGWPNRFLGIDSWAPLKNSVSGLYCHIQISTQFAKQQIGVL